MTASLVQIALFLILAIACVVLLTTRYQVHAFFALLFACALVGLGTGMPASQILAVAKHGFGGIMQSLGLIIVLGTTLGILLEHTGATRVMARFMLQRTGERRAPLAMALTGLVVGLPIFCDSGYIVLSGLNNSLSRRTGISVVIMATSLATGLYAVHCLVPPHPGATAATATLGAPLGRVLAEGTLCAIPAMLTGYGWARYAGNRVPCVLPPAREPATELTRLPSVWQAFLPIIVPIVLIALRSLFTLGGWGTSWPGRLLDFLGDPETALAAGILLAFVGGTNWQRRQVGELLQGAAERAGGILVIIGAGGSFGALLAATNLGEHLGKGSPLASLGLLFPFLVAALLKTAQGSSTVAIITASSIVQPLLPGLGLDNPEGRVLAVLSLGAGSMLMSHANDAYFWVVARFSGMDTRSMLRVYTVATALMGCTTLAVVWLLSRLV
ncbi:MAG TPA: GntP family permease [Chitinophagaceae bacterium]|nr:GntP family permease [Chitinophagaceae bacterium]